MYGKDFDYDNIPPDRRLPIPPEAIEEPSESNKYGSIFLYRKEYPNEKVGKAIILDFETTGLDRFNDDPVELGFLKVTYSKQDGKIFKLQTSTRDLSSLKKKSLQ